MGPDWAIHHIDCRDGLQQLEPETVQLFCTSPPYAQEKVYEKGLDYNGLWLLMIEVAQYSLPACKPGGFFFANFGDTTRYRDSMCHLYTTVFQDAGWIMHSRRVWAKQYAKCSLTGLNNVHSVPVAEYEHLYTFRKAPNDKEIIRSKLSYHAVWNAKGAAGYAGHPAPYPPDLPAQAIEVWSDPGDLIVDPFNGTGSTGVAALQLGRRYIGFELDETWADVSRKRLANVQQPLFVDEQQRFDPAEERRDGGLMY